MKKALKYAVVHKVFPDIKKDNTFTSYNQAESALLQIEEKHQEDYVIVWFI